MNDTTMSFFEERSRDPQLLTWYRFIRVLKKTVMAMDDLMQELDVSRYQFDLLMHVALEKGINQQTCADRMHVTKGNVTQHIDRLEKQGLIRRQREGRDNYLYLTETGHELVESIMPKHDLRVKEILSVLSENELQQFQSILRKFDRSLA